MAVVNQKGNEESEDELDVENLPLFYTRPSFQWTSRNYVPPEPSTRTKFESRPGPVRVLDGSGTALDYFQLFYSDMILNKFVQFTRDNATKKRTEQPEKNKGEWKALTLEKIKVFYGLLIMKDMIHLDRDPHYWQPVTVTSF